MELNESQVIQMCPLPMGFTQKMKLNLHMLMKYHLSARKRTVRFRNLYLDIEMIISEQILTLLKQAQFCKAAGASAKIGSSKK